MWIVPVAVGVVSGGWWRGRSLGRGCSSNAAHVEEGGQGHRHGHVVILLLGHRVLLLKYPIYYG